MALFGICGVHDIHEMNALKWSRLWVHRHSRRDIHHRRSRAMAILLEMAIVAGVGGYLRRHYSRKINQRAMRWTVAIIGFVTAVLFPGKLPAP